MWQDGLESITTTDLNDSAHTTDCAPCGQMLDNNSVCTYDSVHGLRVGDDHEEKNCAEHRIMRPHELLTAIGDSRRSSSTCPQFLPKSEQLDPASPTYRALAPIHPYETMFVCTLRVPETLMTTRRKEEAKMKVFLFLCLHLPLLAKMWLVAVVVRQKDAVPDCAPTDGKSHSSQL